MIIAAIITSLAAVGFHIYLTLQHYQLKLGLTTSPAGCNINASFNCDAVAISPFAVFLGVPIATLGAVANAVLAVLLLVAFFRLSQNSERVRRVAFLLSAFIAVVSVVMGTISSVILRTYCLYCMATYALSFLALFFIWRSMEKGFTSEFGEDIKSLFTDSKWLLGMVFFIPVGSWLANAVVADNYGLSKIKVLIREKTDNWTSAAVIPFNESTGLSLQKENVPPVMTIVEFADFKCGHCRAAYPTLHAFTQGRPDVKLIYKPFPLDGTCNADIPQKGDGSRCRMAYATFCAEKIGKKGWEFHNHFFDHQEMLFAVADLDSTLKELSDENGISIEELKTCMDSTETYDLVASQAKEGANAKISGTPTIFVNGKLLQGGQFLPILENVYRQLKTSK